MPRLSLDDCIHCGEDLHRYRKRSYERADWLAKFIGKYNHYRTTCPKCRKAIWIMNEEQIRIDEKTWKENRDQVLAQSIRS